MRRSALIAVSMGLSLGSCAGLETGPIADWPTPSGGAREVVDCRQAFRTIDRAVDRAAVRDAEAARIEGFPYLRVNRFLASFRDEDLAGDRLSAWLDRLAELDRQARRVEFANLDDDSKQDLDAALERILGGPREAGRLVERCRGVLRGHDLIGEAGIALLRRSARVADHYSTWSRLVGFYPLTSIGVAAGVGRWKSGVRETFRDTEGRSTRSGPRRIFMPAVDKRDHDLGEAEVAAIIAESRNNPLGIPEPTGADLRRLIEHFAPLWRIEQAGAADLIGKPHWAWQEERTVADVDTTETLAYTRLTHTRFGAAILPQISYTVWFKERPKTSRLDIQGGRLDAVVWRVTIGSDGKPLIYDTIHACGCYHLFFPVAPLRKKVTPEDRDLREEALVPSAGPVTARGQRVVIDLAAGSHSVSALHASKPTISDGPATSYRLVPPGDLPDADLRIATLPRASGGASRSLFGPDGIIEGTERLETVLLWPMGIASPGAMRQWGTHATAFVGRRHFDDPYLLDRAFEE